MNIQLISYPHLVNESGCPFMLHLFICSDQDEVITAMLPLYSCSALIQFGEGVNDNEEKN